MSVIPTYEIPFNKVGTLADIYLPARELREAGTSIPTVLYWHGGGKSTRLSCGDRRSYLPVWLITKLTEAGYVFVSADYRLLPPSNGHEILQDVLDFVHWAASSNGLNDELRQIGEQFVINTTRLVVAGTSAGGYLAYMAAIHAQLEHPLRGVLSMYGIGGDLLTRHYLQPKTKPFFRGRPLLNPADFEVLLSITRPPAVVTGSALEYGQDGIPSSPRMFLTRVMLQEGTFLDYLTGEHGLTKRLRDLDAPTMADLPQQHRLLFPQANLGKTFPPTCLVHGTDDSAVLIGESRALRNRLERIGVSCQLLEVAGAEHSFDYSEGHEKLLDEVFQVVQGWFA